ncbi:MAG: phytanoyl-CoA dioxygenase family protein, partial [Bacteroidia bacterium]
LIGTFDTKNFETINKTLNRDGYAYFKNKISPEMVSSLYNYALKTPALAKKNEPKVVFDPSNFVSEIYRFDAQDLINNKDIQSLIMDPALINVARNYLGCEPIFDFPAMWWSTSFLKEASEEAAQLYHFDMDRIKWLKIFIYLTDVNADNGPHRYIRGSHLPGTKPLELLERGYARIPDNDLVKYYKPEDFVVVCAESGTIFAGDTQCWHKGTPLKKGHRLVLELEYTSSMFGANYPKLEVKNSSPEFKKFCSQNKFYASNIHFTN